MSLNVQWQRTRWSPRLRPRVRNKTISSVPRTVRIEWGQMFGPHCYGKLLTWWYIYLKLSDRWLHYLTARHRPYEVQEMKTVKQRHIEKPKLSLLKRANNASESIERRTCSQKKEESRSRHEMLIYRPTFSFGGFCQDSIPLIGPHPKCPQTIIDNRVGSRLHLRTNCWGEAQRNGDREPQLFLKKTESHDWTWAN